jgi:hypothetical protein
VSEDKELKGTCDNCGEVIKIEFKVKQHPKSIQETYIECPECNQHTTCFVTDHWVREMQKKAGYLREQLKKGKNTVNQLNKLFDTIGKRMEKLKGNMIGNEPPAH